MATARVPAKRLACVILAAGKGTRMNTARAKVLHTLLGVPMVSYAVAAARAVGAAPLVCVVGHQRAEVEAALRARHPDVPLAFVEQGEQRGTGHATRLGLTAVPRDAALVLVLCGDAPLLRPATLRALCNRARRTGALTLLTARVADPTGYGRIVRDAAGRVVRIVEHRDASPTERKLDEINSGIVVAPAAFLRRATARLRARNAQRELYLTDVIPAAARGPGVEALLCDHDEVAGINDRAQLAAAEAVLRRRIVARWQRHATFRDPEGSVVEPDVAIEADAEIGRGVVLRGRTRVGDGAIVGDGSILTDTVVGAGAEVKAYSVATEAVIGPGAKVGPFAHLRPGTELGPDVHVGNFVETKKARLGRGSKANHLTYLGDATIGERVNVGAGTITCNYNGYEKRETVIEDGAFIGSDAQLVAPVRVGARAVVAAGTTVTEDVPAGALVLTRPRVKIKKGYADKIALRYAARKP